MIKDLFRKYCRRLLKKPKVLDRTLPSPTIRAHYQGATMTIRRDGQQRYGMTPYAPGASGNGNLPPRPSTRLGFLNHGLLR